MSWITEQLAVGGSFPFERAGHLVCKLRIEAAIDLRGEEVPDCESLAQQGIDLLHLPTEDLGPIADGDIEHGIRFATEHLDRGKRLLVHCAYGIGRSATLALCLLVHKGFAPLDALALMKARRAMIAPSPSQFRCWEAWLDSFRFSNDVDWPLPTYTQFKLIAYQRSSDQSSVLARRNASGSAK
ncbi:protein-tyrosine phosphatase family protein [Variovorax sp. PBL-E5]|uniref:protein-tyrosine phosphatase family protein n=1 Tax=Variovorax sp. PBL-E5 TaxID=434014 RepID=UPI001E3EDA62|nr:dual specificity protein phosphatase family protein [Variovorax sp. PBL-E5]